MLNEAEQPLDNTEELKMPQTPEELRKMLDLAHRVGQEEGATAALNRIREEWRGSMTPIIGGAELLALPPQAPTPAEIEQFYELVEERTTELDAMFKKIGEGVKDGSIAVQKNSSGVFRLEPVGRPPINIRRIK